MLYVAFDEVRIAVLIVTKLLRVVILKLVKHAKHLWIEQWSK